MKKHLFGLLLACGLVGQASASPMMYEFTFAGPNLQGSWLFDDAGIGSDTNPNTQLSNQTITALSGSSITVNGDQLDVTGATVRVFDDIFLGKDFFAIDFDVASGSQIGGFDVLLFSLQQSGPDNILASDNMLAAFPADYSFSKTLFVNLDGAENLALPVSETDFSSSPIPPVSNVSVPASVWLFGSGLIGLFGIRKRSMLKK